MAGEGFICIYNFDLALDADEVTRHCRLIPLSLLF
jgi:hypothetical protein